MDGRNSPRPFDLARGMSSSESEDIWKRKGDKRGGEGGGFGGVGRGNELWKLVNTGRAVTRIHFAGKVGRASERVGR
jgi:hypothetical protein